MIEEEIKITGNTSEAQKSFEDLGKVIAEQKQITIEFEKELLDLEQQLVATGNADWNPKGDALKKKIVGIKEAIKDQRIALKDLNGQRTKAKKNQEDYTKGLNKTSGVVKVLNKLTGGLAGELLNLGKAATKGGKAMRVALISSGIGAAVALVGFLVEHWDTIAETLGLVNKELEIQKEANIENLRVVDGELSLLEKQIKYNDLRNISNTENLAKQKQLLTAKDALIKSNIKILELQLLKEKSTANELTTSQKLQVTALYLLGQSTQAAMLRAKFVATDIEEAQRQNELQEELNKLKGDELDIDLLLNPPTGKSTKDKEKERKKLLIDLDKLQQQALEENLSKQEKEIQGVRNKYDKIIREAKAAGIETGLVEEGRLQAIEVINAKYRAIDLKEFEKNEKIKRDILDRVGVEGLEAKIMAIEVQAEEDAAELERLGAHRDQIEAVYQASEDRIAEIVKGASDKVVKQNETDGKKGIKTAEEVAAAKDAVIWNSVDNIDKSFQALAALDEENKGLQATALIASNLIGAAKTIQSTVAANAAATAAFPLTAGQPFVAINTVAAGLGIAASAAATQKGLAALGKGGSTGGDTGLGGAGGASAPSFNLVEGTESNQISESIQGGNEPIKAVVISGDVTTAQQVDRNIVEGSGL